MIKSLLHWDFVGEFTPDLHYFTGWVILNSSLALSLKKRRGQVPLFLREGFRVSSIILTYSLVILVLILCDSTIASGKPKPLWDNFPT
jgi:hypothetical protein